MSESKKAKFQLVPDLLHTPLERFDFNNPPVDPIQLAIDLTETMLFHNGLGLAANQCGLPYRVCAIRSDPVIVMFNPKIVDWSEEHDVLDEGCLSFPNMLVKVKRPKYIRIRYTRPNGETVTERYAGMTARIMCHEIQHLDGMLFTHQMTKFELRLMIERFNKKHRTRYQISDFRSKSET